MRKPETKKERATVTCPGCGKLVPWRAESRWRPFCSERCKLIDLGAWLNGYHRIAEPAPMDSPYDPDEGPLG